MDTIFGLPAHILLIHPVVVVCPLAGLFGLGVAASSRWAFYLRWPLIFSAFLGAVSAFLAANAGAQFKNRLGIDSPAVTQHAADGALLRIIALVYFVMALAAFLLIAVESPLKSGRGALKPRAPAWTGILTRVLLAGVAVWLIVQTILTGHSGSEAVWGGVS